MEEPFELPVSFNGKDMIFNARLLIMGYTHKIQVEVNGVDVLFEPDEERNYRAVIDASQQESRKMDIHLLKAIAETIESIVK